MRFTTNLFVVVMFVGTARAQNGNPLAHLIASQLCALTSSVCSVLCSFLGSVT